MIHLDSYYIPYDDVNFSKDYLKFNIILFDKTLADSNNAQAIRDTNLFYHTQETKIDTVLREAFHHRRAVASR